MLQPNNQLQHQSPTCNYPTPQPPAPFTPKKTHYVSNMLHVDDAPNRQKHLPLSTSFHASIMQHVHLELHYRYHPTQAFTGLPPRRSLLPTPIGSTHHLCTKLIRSNRTHTSLLKKRRCRDGNVCEAYVIPFLFGSFFTVCHPYIDVHFLKCFFCDFVIALFDSVNQVINRRDKDQRSCLSGVSIRFTLMYIS